MEDLTIFTKYVIIPALFLIFLIILGFIYPTSSELYQEQFKSGVTKTRFKSNRLKVVNKYFNGLFKKVVFIDKGNIEKRYYINNYFKKKFVLLKIVKNF